METESGAVLLAQLDYIHFSFGLILFLLGAVCVSISRSGPLPTPWWMLGGFAFTLGVAEWVDVLLVGTGLPGTLGSLDVLLRAASFSFLLEFARRTTRLLTGDTPGPWIYGPAVAVLAAVAVVVGTEGLEAALRLVLAGPAAFWTAGLFFLAARRTRDLGGAAASRRARGFAAAFFALFGLSAGLVLPPAPFLPEGWPGPAEFLAWTGVPVTLVRALLVGGMSLSVWSLAVSFDPRGRTLRKRRALFWVVASAIVALLAGGWLFTERLGRLHESDTVADAEAAADAAHDHVVASLDAANRLTRTLAAIVERYGGGGSPGKAGELDVLVDALAAGQQDVIVYVLDADGTAIASSNRASPSSLVGRNFRERLYFRSARAGKPGRFTGVGMVTGVPGYFASEPVRGTSGEVSAVAVVKQDLVPVLVDPGGSGHVTIVSPGGDVVLSTRPGGTASPPSLPGTAAGTSWKTLDGRRHVAVVRDLPGTDWSLVLLQPERARLTDRLLGIVITLLLCVVVLGAFVAMERQLGAEVRIATKRREAEGRARELARQVDTDALTGALNRQGFNDAMAREVSRSRRHGQPLAVVMVDIDHFKRVNDEFGHAAGDQVLVRTANLLRSCVRESDAVARWGGEEFVVIAPMTGEEGGVALAEKLRAIMAATHLGPRDAVTASFGVAELEPDDTIDSLLRRADGALYRAKESGRNRVCGATGGTVARPSRSHPEDPTKEDPLGLRNRMYTDTGFGPIDVEHVTLSRALHALVHEVNSGKVEEVAASLDGVLRGVEAHFAHEESLMARFGYPQRQRHAEAHAAFLGDVRKSVQELREKGITPGFRRWAVARLPDWFRFHILAHDMGLGKFLLRAGAEEDQAAPAGGREGPGPEPTRRS